MADQKKNRKKVLVASCILAALIVGSSSFAWFTSKDEVVNKLSAKNGYDVAIVEDFNPPTNWTPGQTVEKAVKVTNTGNVDAFVKMSLDNSLVLTTKEATGDNTYTEGNVKKYIELTTEDSKKLLKAGGRLVYKSDEVYNKDNIISEVPGTDFKPTADGFYIFERNNSTDTETKNNYVGFYFKDDTTSTEVGVGKYYAITATDDGSKLTGYSIDKTKSETVTPTLTYIPEDNENSKPAYIKAATSDNSIVININLNATELAKWTVDGTKADELKDELQAPSFYYNFVLEAGQTTSDPLISSLQLDSSVEKDAFIDMEYNLKVKVDSAQVVDNRTDEANAVTAVNAQGWTMTAAFDSNNSASKNDDTVSWTKNPSTP